MTNVRLTNTLAAIDAINQQDPNFEDVQGRSIPKELCYSQRMTECLNAHWPEASELLQVAVRAQHLKRWHLKRSEFPEGRVGYLDWRKQQARLHAELAGDIMATQGYTQADIEIVAGILRKEKLKSNPEVQTLEDVACLVFLQYYFEAFANKHDHAKVVDIVRKTWKKMSVEGHRIASKLTLPAFLILIIDEALS